MPEFDFNTLITDRSQGDLDALRSLLSTPLADWTAEQLAEFNLAKSKGAYNYTDLNRVTACMDYLNEVLTGLGYVTGYVPVEVPHGGSGSRLPEGYTELEYIEASENQWLNTGFNPNQNTRLVMDFEIMDSGNLRGVFGSRIAYLNTAYGLFSNGNGQHTMFQDDFGNSTNNPIPSTVGRYFVDKNKNETEINESTHTFPSATFQSQYSLYLFAVNTAGTPTGLEGSIRLYSCQIYDNGTLIRDYVPCTNPSGQVGLYDLKTEEFYGNSGTGSFIAGPAPVKLPDGYTQLEYIQSSGTQYIDTGFKPDVNTRVIAEISDYTSGTAGMFGERPVASSSADTQFGIIVPASPSNTVRLDWFGGQTASITTDSLLARTIIDVNKNTLSAYGETVSVNYRSTGESIYNMYLFCYNNVGEANYLCSYKMYRFQVYDGAVLVRNFIPCKDPSGNIGLYDLVNLAFYENAGSGSFTAGQEVSPPEDPASELDPYTWYEEDIPISATMTAYLSNVAALRGVLTLGEDTPEVPGDMVGLTLAEANAIEQILDALNDYLEAMQEIYFRSGMVWAVSGGPGFYFQS